ncbi:hypothetical protein V6N13_037561 [Hibiscus sabdariffa]|uniref:Uncharacterized protein n=1 Tax=Hibiscus sabdariffa TaxID=183260 RepID=A0ABR2S4S1_9ROSI
MYTAKEVKKQVDEAKKDVSKYKRQYDDLKKQIGIRIREIKEEHQREIARKNHQNQALEEQIRQLETIFAEREKVEYLRARISDLEEQNQGYLEQLQEAQSQQDLSQQMTQQINEEKVWLRQRLPEFEETYQDTVARLNSANLLLNADEREIVDTLRHAGELIRDQGKITERNRAWTKEMAIHVVTMA